MRRATLLAAVPLVLAGLAAPPPASAAPSAASSGARPTASRACAAPEPGYAACLALVRTDRAAETSTAANAPAGYRPADLRTAYELPTNGGAGQTIAIVDAYDNPHAESDLAQYRAQFGLSSCTTANSCLRKVNQDGVAGSYPKSNRGWALEISLDLDMASAICADCNILLVEASTASFRNLAAAVDTAARLGADVISNSYGGSEFSGERNLESHYRHPGVAVVASSGDSGYGTQFPAASRFVTAVGGTTLRRASNARGWAERAWSGAGSGCSAYIAKPTWQADPGCGRRSVADVAAVADPATGVAVYDTLSGGGWTVVGGTSVSAPVIAGVYALAGNASAVQYGSYPYAHRSALWDVAAGRNGSCGGYLCTAVAGYDGPTGLGTPHGTGAF